MRRCWPADRRRTGSVGEPAGEAEAVASPPSISAAVAPTVAPQKRTFSVDREVEVEAVAVAEQPDAAADLRRDRSARSQPSTVPRAAGERQQAGAHAQQRRLAGAVGPAQQHDLAGCDGQRHAGQRREPAEHGDDAVELDDGRAASIHRRRR